MTRSVIVETVTGRSTAELRAARDGATAALVELRLDGVPDLDVAGALEGRRTPVIATCRPVWEGGRFDGSEDERLKILGQAIALGAEYVDLEWRADRRGLPVGGRTRVVLSHHDFDRMPADLADKVQAMQGERPDVLKVAVQPTRLSDCITLRDVLRIDTPHVAIAMGSAGHLTRLCPWLFGSCWTYGGEAAPGQVAVRDLQDLYRIEDRSTATALYGIAGKPLGHSASPAMHNPALHAARLDAVYVTFETSDADEFLAVAEAFGVAGASVTAPLKPAVFARVGRVDTLTTDTGALNTIKRCGSEWEGRNFDVAGFLSPLEQRSTPLAGAKAVIMGAGGSARTAAWALRSKGAQVAIAARRTDRAEALASEFGIDVLAWPPAPGWDLLVNTTPVGTWPATGDAPIARELVRGRCVYDLIYNPAETTLLKWAREAGAETIGGLEMLVGQACHQFRWWTGIEAPVTTIADAARAFVARAQRQI